MKTIAFQYYRFIELAIRQCRSCGIDCKVHGLIMVGKRHTDEEEIWTPAAFLVSDTEEVEAEVAILSKKAKVEPKKEVTTRVYVWGLNDKDQLGGLKGSKASSDSYKMVLVVLVLRICSFLSDCR